MAEFQSPTFPSSIFVWTCFLACCISANPARGAERPNIVIVLVDDMGFSDIGCYGSEIPTPNLDELAKNGLKFTQFYNTGRCCPTRASLLTGLYAHQAGMGHMTSNLGVPSYQGYLNDRCVTIAEVARSAGYMTTMTGKWHVGANNESQLPRARGFDRFYGVPEGGGFYFQVKQGRTVRLNDEVVASTEKPLPEGWYSTDAFTEYGLKFVDEAVAAKKPFLMYLAHNAPHFPLQATAEQIARHRGKYLAGWDKLSQARWQKQLEIELVKPEWSSAAASPGIRRWATLSEKERDQLDHQMAVYAACVENMDTSIGTLVDGLKTRGQLDNTLILFMSDNGGCAEGGLEGKAVGDPTTPNSNWFCGKSWAWLQDTPFRKYKHYNHEGGIATPLIAHWPNGIKDSGTMRHSPAHVIDVMATVAELTEAEYPTEQNGHAILPMEGRSLTPLLIADTVLERDGLFWEYEGNAAVRQKDWKLVRQGGKGPWELYNMVTDRTELHDLAAAEPDRVSSLAAAWTDWADRCGVSKTGLPKKRGKAQSNTGAKRKRKSD